jgi:hypothetical protein
LPSAITVTIGGNTATAGTDYTWDSSTGALSIQGNKVTGNIVITVTGTEASGSSTNNRIEAEIYIRDSKKNTNDLYAIVYAPIIVTLNTFGLASLNA